MREKMDEKIVKEKMIENFMEEKIHEIIKIHVQRKFREEKDKTLFHQQPQWHLSYKRAWGLPVEQQHSWPLAVAATI